MAFALDVIVNNTTYSLSDGAPFRLENATGLGMADLYRLEEQGPRQDGVTDRGYRLRPRVITLSLGFVAASASQLDGYRDDLMDIFKPVRGYTIALRVTRDDGEIRQIDCQPIGPIDIGLVPDNRPGNLHRAVVQLRAADPRWYDPTQQSATVNTALWYLGDYSVDPDIILERAENPSVDQAWTYTGTHNGTYTILVRSGYVNYGTVGSNDRYMYLTGGSIQGFYANSSNGYNTLNGVPSTTWMALGTHVYTIVQEFTTNQDVYRDAAALTGDRFLSATHQPLRGNGAYWRGKGSGTANQWPAAITHAAVYNQWIPIATQQKIISAMAGSTPWVAETAYNGDIAEYPIIEVRGYIADFEIENISTGKTLDFTGATVNAGEVLTIDLASGRKTITDSQGSNQSALLNYADSDLLDWSLQPSPVVTGGTNVLRVSGGSVDTDSAEVTVRYYNRYVSW